MHLFMLQTENFHPGSSLHYLAVFLLGCFNKAATCFNQLRENSLNKTKWIKIICFVFAVRNILGWSETEGACGYFLQWAL